MGTRRGNNEGSIYRRADGRWCGAVTLGYGPGGKVLRQSFTGHSRSEVRDKVSAALARHRAGLEPEADKLTVEQFLQKWLADSVKPTARPTTYRTYEGEVRLHIVPALGHIRLAKLSPSQVQAFLNTAKGANGQPLAPASVQLTRATLRRALNQAVRWGLVTRNVASLVDNPRVARYPAQVWDAQQAGRFLEAVRGNSLEGVYTLILSLGLRRGEALALRWEDVDLEAGRVAITATLEYVDRALRRMPTKTEQSSATLALPRVACDALRAQRQRQAFAQRKAGWRWRDTGYVFTTRHGGPFHPDYVTHQFQRIIRFADLPLIRLHDLRHSAASLLLAEGASLRDVSELLRHTSIKMTADIYGHQYEEQRRKVAEKMDDILRKHGS